MDVERSRRGELVGRARECAEAIEMLDDALARRGGLLLITGEPGIGKTRLADELADQARDREAIVISGRAAVAEDAPPYWVWIEALRELLRLKGRAHVIEHSGAGLEDIVQLLPELREKDDGAAAIEYTGTRFRLFDSVSLLLRAEAEDSGLIVVLDDLQWADAASLQLLVHVTRWLPQTRLLCIAAYRDVEVAGAHPLSAVLADLYAEPTCRHIVLGGLDRDAVRIFLAGRAGVHAADSLTDAVVERTGGNPFFLREYVSLLRDEGVMLSSGRPALPVAIPRGVREVIGRRVDRLGEDCAGLLRMASVAGRDLDIDVLARAASLARDEVLALIDRGFAGRLLVADPHVPGRIAFAHDLVCESLYDSVPPSERARIHHRLAEAIELVHKGELDGHLAALARHWLGAALTDASHAAMYAQRAAERAVTQLAYEEAARLYRVCLDVGDANDVLSRCELLLRLADAQYRSGDVDDSMRTCQEAAADARRVERHDLLAEAALTVQGVGESRITSAVDALCVEALAGIGSEDSAIRARLLGQLCMAREYEGQRPEAEEMSRDAVAMAERVRDSGAVVAALQARQIVRSGPDGIDERADLGTRMLELSVTGAGPMAALWGHLWRVDTFSQRGDIDAAVTELDELTPVVDKIREPLARWHLLRARSLIAALRGDFAAGLGLAADARRLGRHGQHLPAELFYNVFALSLGRLTGDFGDTIEQMEAAPGHGLRIASNLVALAHLDLGHVDRARYWYESAPSLDFARIPRSALLPFAAYWGELVARLEDSQPAVEVFDWLQPYSRLFISGGAGSAFNFASASRYLGLLATSLRRWDEAAAYFQQAIADNTKARALPFVALAQVDYAEMLQLRGVSPDRARARTLAGEARQIADRLGMRLLLDRLAVLEQALGNAPSHPLSRREVEVAGLVARGLTSRQIAAALHVSERTAEHHVDSIRTKLGFASRSQIAGWAVVNGIAGSTKLGT